MPIEGKGLLRPEVAAKAWTASSTAELGSRGAIQIAALALTALDALAI